MPGFNYPLRVLKRKLQSKNYKPFAIDSSTGKTMELQTGRAEKFGYIALNMLLVALALSILTFTILFPLVETTESRINLDNTIQTLGGNDEATLDKLKSKGKIISESVNSGIITLIIKIEPTKMKEALELSMTLSGVKEVTTDGNTIAIEFLSSAK